MSALFSLVLDIAVLVFGVSSMLSIGLRYTVREIVEPLRDIRGVSKALLANFVLLPAMAFLISRLLSLDPSAETGLVLVATAAGAAFLIKLSQIADGDAAFASGLLVMLLVVTIAYMPLVVPLIAPGATVGVASIAFPLVLTLLLPLGVGFALDEWSPRWSARILPFANSVSTISLVVLVLATFAANFQAILDTFGTGAILASFLLVAGALGLGYLLGGSTPARRSVLALATAQRNIAAATVVATQSLDDPDTLVMVVVTSLLSMAVLFPVARMLGRTRREHVGDRG